VSKSERDPSLPIGVESIYKQRTAMSEITKDFDFSRMGRPRLYPWDEWSDGQIRILRKGTDFDCEADSIQNGIYVYARRMGYKASTKRISWDQVACQITKP